MAGTNAALYALSAASTVSQFAAERRQAGALEDQGAYERALFGQNAATADLQAEDAVARGHEAELRQRTATRQLRGSQRAGLAAQGIALDSGSALDVQLETESMGELDALTIRNNARREAFGFRTQATDLRRQGELAELSARNQAKAIRTASSGTLLTGAANLYGIYRQTHDGGGRKKPSSAAHTHPSGSR